MGALVEINTDGLAKLGKTIGEWFGLDARAMEKRADAEAYATICRAKAENAAALIRQQGKEQLADYICAREERKMNNANSVVKYAQQHFAEGELVASEPVNNDWTNRFFDIVENVSDVEMQQLWGRILAGEVKQPKSYSLRTLEILRNMTKEEAEHITRVSPFVMYGGIICSEDFGADIDTLSLLDELGLICGESMIYTYTIKPDKPNNIIIDKKHFFSLYSSTEIKVNIKHYILTKAGKEVFALTEEDNGKFIIDLANHFKAFKISKITLNEIIRWNGTSYSYLNNNAREL